MSHVVMAWIGPTFTGHGSAVCVECGWNVRDRIYGTVALQALAHDRRHAPQPPPGHIFA